MQYEKSILIGGKQLRGHGTFAPLNRAFFCFFFDMWKLKRFATYSLELELSTRSTNDKKQDFCKSWLLEERTSSGTQLGCLSKILISFPYLISWECALLADGCELGVTVPGQDHNVYCIKWEYPATQETGTEQWLHCN